MSNQEKQGSLAVKGMGAASSLRLSDPAELLKPEDKQRLDRSLEEMARLRRQAESSAQNISLS
jgi:hypothetical protein